MADQAGSRLNPLVPGDSRVQHLDVKIGDYNYHYMLASPPSPVATILLVHGWPDLGMAWRNQIPWLASLGLRVIAPDMLGYGQTSAPADLNEYTTKKLSGHLIQLVDHVLGKECQGEKFILGGHDWGAVIVLRMTMWHQDRIRAVFSLNVPYTPPSPAWVPLEAVVERIPSFKYQLQLASPVAEAIIDKSPENLRQFINGIYGGSGPNGELAFTTNEGLVEENLPKIGPAKLMKPEMVDYYVREFSRNGFHGPTNYYRTRRPNYEEEKPLADAEVGFKFQVPAMVVMGEKDRALPPKLADGMEQWFDAGLQKHVAKGVSHWAMWEDPELINGYIGEFLGSVLGDKVKEKL